MVVGPAESGAAVAGCRNLPDCETDWRATESSSITFLSFENQKRGEYLGVYTERAGAVGSVRARAGTILKAFHTRLAVEKNECSREVAAHYDVIGEKLKLYGSPHLRP